MLLGVGQSLTTLINSLRPPATEYLLTVILHALFSEPWLS